MSWMVITLRVYLVPDIARHVDVSGRSLNILQRETIQKKTEKACNVYCSKHARAQTPDNQKYSTLRNRLDWEVPGAEEL